MPEAFFDLLALDRRRHEYDRDVRDIGHRAHRVGQLEAIHNRHRHVAEDYVRTNALNEIESSLPILGDVHVVGRRAHRGLHELSDHRVVLAEDDLAHEAASVTSERAAALRGKMTWNTDPAPTVLSAQTVPPWSCTI